MKTEKYDLIIVGAGSGNMIPVPEMDSWRLAIVEPDKFGGTCLNRGCIPSKMLLYAAEVAEMARHGARLGVHHGRAQVDWQRLVGRVWQQIDPVAEAGAQYRRSQPNVTVYDAAARFVAPYVLETGGHRITAERIALGAGSRPLVPDIPGLQDVTYHTSDTIMHLDRQPASLLIVGGGYIGVEMAHFFGSLGTHVTLTDRGAALIKRQDDDVAQAFTRIYERRFDVLLRSRVTGLSPENARIAAHLDVDGTPRTITVDTVLVAGGRQPNSDRLNVAAAGIEVDDRGRVLTDDGMETSVPGIFAFGDLASRHPPQAHRQRRGPGDCGTPYRRRQAAGGLRRGAQRGLQFPSGGRRRPDRTRRRAPGPSPHDGAAAVRRHRLRLGHGGRGELRQAGRRPGQPPAARRAYPGRARLAAHPAAGAGHEIRPDH